MTTLAETTDRVVRQWQSQLESLGLSPKSFTCSARVRDSHIVIAPLYITHIHVYSYTYYWQYSFGFWGISWHVCGCGKLGLHLMKMRASSETRQDEARRDEARRVVSLSLWTRVSTGSWRLHRSHRRLRRGRLCLPFPLL